MRYKGKVRWKGGESFLGLGEVGIINTRAQGEFCNFDQVFEAMALWHVEGLLARLFWPCWDRWRQGHVIFLWSLSGRSGKWAAMLAAYLLFLLLLLGFPLSTHTTKGKFTISSVHHWKLLYWNGKKIQLSSTRITSDWSLWGGKQSPCLCEFT